MTNTEINEAVARKLGWVQCCNPRTIENWKIVDCFGWSKGGSHFHEPYPNYCGSIAAAWEIMEYLQKNKRPFIIQIGGCMNNPCACGQFEKWIYLCRIHEVEKPFGDGTHGHADTPAMAICLAFLKLEVTP